MSETSRNLRFQEARATLSRIIDATPSGVRHNLNAQLSTIVFVERLTTMLDFELGTGLADRVDLPDGPIDVETTVLDNDGSYAGEILVWVNQGYLSGMEYASVTAEYPTSWPSDSAVVVSSTPSSQ